MKEKDSSIHAGHRQRLKEQVAARGFLGLHPHQILEYLLFFAIPYKDTNPIAHTLIQRFGSLGGVLDASPEALLSVPNMTQNATLLLTTLPALFRQYTSEKSVPKSILRATDILPYLNAHLQFRAVESLHILCLGAKGELIHSDSIADGGSLSVDSAAKKIVESALRHKAAGVILAHNHPSDNVAPSKEDTASTAAVKHLLNSLGISLIDHIIIGNQFAYSFFLKTKLTENTPSIACYPFIPLANK